MGIGAAGVMFSVNIGCPFLERAFTITWLFMMDGYLGGVEVLTKVSNLHHTWLAKQ